MKVNFFFFSFFLIFDFLIFEREYNKIIWVLERLGLGGKGGREGGAGRMRLWGIEGAKEEGEGGHQIC